MSEDYPEPPRTEWGDLAILSEAEDPEDYRNLHGKVLDEENWKAIQQKILAEGTYAERPATAPFDGAKYHATDINTVFVWNNSDGEWNALNTGTSDDPVPGTTHLEALNADELNNVRQAGGASDVGAEISQAIADGVSLYVPPRVSQSYMTPGSPISETPHDGFSLIVHEDAPPLDGSGLSSGTRILEFAGSITNTISVDADVSEGDTTISVSDTSPFSAGDVVKLSSDDSFNPARASYTKGELGVVASVDGTNNNVDVEWPTLDSYSSANSAQLERISAITNVEISGFSVTGIGSSSGTQNGIHVEHGVNCTIDESEVFDVENTGITLADCLWSTIKDCEAHGIRGSTGYGQHFGAATMFSRIVDCTSWNCRRGFDATGGDVTRFCSFENPTAWGCDINITTHGGAEHITMLNPQSGSTTDDAGITVRSPDTTVLGGHSRNASGHNVATSEGGGLRFSLIGHTTRGATIHNISLSGENADYKQDVEIIGVTSTEAGNSGLSSASDFSGITVQGGKFSYNAQWGLRFFDASDVRVDTTAKNNSQSSAGSYSGLYLQSTGSGGVHHMIAGHFLDDQEEATQQYGVNRDDADHDYTGLDNIIATGNVNGADNVTADTNDAKGMILS